VLEPLGFGVVSDGPDPAGRTEVGFGDSDGSEFAIHEPADRPGQDTVTQGAHIAFVAADAETVISFYERALAHGAPGIGEPGPRPEYNPGYFGVFVLDPDGNNIEAVWHGAAGGENEVAHAAGR
jgi:catechol 2,3-dioxygenase-like lactoylglutathione lyase family enzyme